MQGNVFFQQPNKEQRKVAAWQKCRPLLGNNPASWRVDDFGFTIGWHEYGTHGEYGWEIDHIIPTAIGGSDDLSNLRALHYKANRSQGGLLGAQLSNFRKA